MPTPIYPLKGKLIAVSVSEHEDLAALGYSPEHLNLLCLRLTRELLREGASIAYGGVLGIGDYTESIYKAARQELENHPSRKVGAKLSTPFINYQPWPWCLKVSAEQIARDRAICRYVKVMDREIPGEATGKDLDDPRAALASSIMRKQMAIDCDARIAIGGKMAKFVGVMPGILEEALYHLEQSKPLYIVGGFGGAAAKLAEDLLGSIDAPVGIKESLRNGKQSLDALLNAYPEQPRDKMQFDVTSSEAKSSYSRLEEQIVAIRKAGLSSGLRNGLDTTANTQLMRSENDTEIVRLVQQGLSKLME